MQIRLQVPVLLSAMVLSSCVLAEDESCLHRLQVLRTDNSVDFVYCDDSAQSRLDAFPLDGATYEIDSSQFAVSGSHAVLSRVLDLSGGSKSVEVHVFSLDSRTKLIQGSSTTTATIDDRNKDGIGEILLFGHGYQFDSIALVEIGIPIVIELSQPISIGHLSGYPELREHILSSAKGHSEVLMMACKFGGVFDENCGAASDIRKLSALIEELGND